jgi:hypothetical protein
MQYITFKNKSIMKKIISLLVLSMTLTFIAPVSTVIAQSPTERVEQAKAQKEAMLQSMQTQQDSIQAVQDAQQAVYDAQNQRSKRIIWGIVIIGVLIAAIAFWAKNKSAILSILRIFTGGYRVKGDVTTLESKKILTGAIYADQQGAYLNTLKADIGSKLYTILGEWWGINGKDSALETLDYLKNKSFTYYFPTVYKAFQAGSDEERKSIILAAMTNQEDAEKAYSQTLNLLESIDVLKTTKLIQT